MCQVNKDNCVLLDGGRFNVDYSLCIMQNLTLKLVMSADDDVSIHFQMG